MGCDCGNCPDSSVLVLNEGADGLNGLFGGFSSGWLFETNTSTPPSNRYIRFNNSTLSSVTQIYINELNQNSISHVNFLNSFNTYGTYGLLKVFDQFDSTKFWFGRVDNLVDSGTYFTLTVTHIFSNGTFTNNSAIVVSHIPANSNSSISIFNGYNLGTVGSLVFSNLYTETIPANTLLADGEKLKVRIALRYAGTSFNSKYRIRINGLDLDANYPSFFLSPYHQRVVVEFSFDRVNNTTSFVDLTTRTLDQYYNWTVDSGLFDSQGGFNFTSTPFTINVDGIVGVSGELIYLDLFEIIKIN